MYQVKGPVFLAIRKDIFGVINDYQYIENQTGLTFKLVFFDTLASCLIYNDENSASNMGVLRKGL